MSQDPSAGDTGADSSAPDQSQQGYIIEIMCMPGDKFMVSVEQPGQEQSEGPEGGADDSQGQQAGSIKEMLTTVLDIVKNGGQVADAMGGDSMSSSDAFKSGYDGGAGGDMSAPAGPGGM